MQYLNLSTWFVPQISLKTGHKSLFERKLYWYKDRSLLDWQNWTWRKTTDQSQNVAIQFIITVFNSKTTFDISCHSQ